MQLHDGHRAAGKGQSEGLGVTGHIGEALHGM